MFRLKAPQYVFVNSCLPILLSLPVLASAIEQADVTGAPFPTNDILGIAAVTLIIATCLGGFAMWKSATVEKVTERAFERMGSLIAYHPLKFIFSSVIVVVVAGYGFALQEVETDPSKSWVPTGSVVLDHQQIVKDNWPSEVRPEFMMSFIRDGPSGNVLSPVMLQSLYRDLQVVLDFEVDGDKIVDANSDGTTKSAAQFSGVWTFDGRRGTQRKCYTFNGVDCGFQSVLAVFGMNATIIGDLTDTIIQDSLRAWDVAPINSMVASLSVWKSFELPDVLSGMVRNSNGDIVSATVLRTTFFLTSVLAEVKVVENAPVSLADPVAETWEANMVCVLGFTGNHPIDETLCSKTTELEHTGLVGRSISDEFGDAIGNDISMVGISYVLIVLYLVANLGKRDSVHSMVSQSFGTLLVVSFAFVLSSGLGGYFGVKTSPLNNNIPFLLIGLGVDDAFVLCSEFVRHSVSQPELSIEERIKLTTRSGGLSVLVTSLTDALVFLIGAATVLPALSSFCIYAGIAVSGCFIFMMTLFLPLLVLNAKRADANRFDVLCCFKSSLEHRIEEPHGCCACFPCCGAPQPTKPILERVMHDFGIVVCKTSLGKLFTLCIFGGIFVAGLVGLTQLEKEFKIEWFLPEESYVNDFITLNDKYFGQGEQFTVYGNNVDLYAKRQELIDIGDYLNAQNFIVPGSTSAWWPLFVNATGPHATAAAFWSDLSQWLESTQGFMYNSKVQWINSANPSQGVSNIKIVESTLSAFEGEGSGKERYEVYYTMRRDIRDIVGGSDTSAFPYTANFLYWEEVGVIDSELIRNLIVAFGVMCAIIAMLIPKLRIALFVAINIAMSIVEVIGFAHYWGVTMNGVSTIYFLMCAGFAVDYSAHIAHAFNSAVGSSSDRAVEALTRLGPCVWHAIFSTFLAVVVLGFTSSFVFEVFFKVLCLVCIVAGAHGIWLLPTMLSIVGGDNSSPALGEVGSTKTPQENDKTDVAVENNARPRRYAWQCCRKAPSKPDQRPTV